MLDMQTCSGLSSSSRRSRSSSSSRSRKGDSDLEVQLKRSSKRLRGEIQTEAYRNCKKQQQQQQQQELNQHHQQHQQAEMELEKRGNDDAEKNAHEKKRTARNFDHFARFLGERTPFVGLNFEANAHEAYETLQNARVLCVGAGGLGVEILKNLALSGFNEVHVVDMDKVDVSNLNRQFLFRSNDVEKYKAQVAADAVMSRVPGIRIKAHAKAIQDFSKKWYKQFTVVIAGLDNVEARQWLNETLIDLVEYNEEGEIDTSSIIPLIDGGTEAFSGQARVMLPGFSSCFECQMASMTPQTNFPMCTIRNVPRLPEHCVAYALKVLWPMLVSLESATDYVMYERKSPDDDFIPNGVNLDKDNIHHMTWLYNRALERAQQFGIQGVTFSNTMQVVKHIIPAIASTNALIAAACVNEAFKFITDSARLLNNYYMYIGAGANGIHSETYNYARNPNCAACRMPLIIRSMPTMSLQSVFEQVVASTNLEEPAAIFNGRVLFLEKFRDIYADNLQKSLEELGICDNSRIVFNSANADTLKVIIKFS